MILLLLNQQQQYDSLILNPLSACASNFVPVTVTDSDCVCCTGAHHCSYSRHAGSCSTASPKFKTILFIPAAVSNSPTRTTGSSTRTTGSSASSDKKGTMKFCFVLVWAMHFRHTDRQTDRLTDGRTDGPTDPPRMISIPLVMNYLYLQSPTPPPTKLKEPIPAEHMAVVQTLDDLLDRCRKMAVNPVWMP